MKTHDLKLSSNFFDAVRDGDKTFEARYNDRGFQKGDKLRLFRHGADRKTGEYGYMNYRGEVVGDEPTAPGVEVIEYLVSYVLTGERWGIKDGFVVMGLREVVPSVPELEAGYMPPPPPSKNS